MVRPFALVPVAALVLCSCADAPTGAPSTADPPSLATGASVDKGEGVFVAHSTFFLPCLGETITENSRIPFRYHLVQTPNGNVHYSEMYIPGTATGTFVTQSGTTWTLERVVSPFVSSVNGSGDVMFFTANILWRSEDGRTLHLQPNYHFKRNASGEVVLEFNNGHCTLT